MHPKGKVERKASMHYQFTGKWAEATTPGAQL
jgi:hypothetical protein